MSFVTSGEFNHIFEDEKDAYIYMSTLNRASVRGSEKFLKLFYCLKESVHDKKMFNYFKTLYCKSKDEKSSFAKTKFISMVEMIYNRENIKFMKQWNDDFKDKAKILLREAIEANNTDITIFLLDWLVKTTDHMLNREFSRVKFISSFSDLLCRIDRKVVGLIAEKLKIPMLNIYIDVIAGRTKPSPILKNSSFRYFIRGVSDIKILRELEKDYLKDILKYLQVMILYPVTRGDYQLLDYYLEKVENLPEKSKINIFVNMFYACRDLEMFSYLLSIQRRLSLSIEKSKFAYSKFVNPYLYSLIMKL